MGPGAGFILGPRGESQYTLRGRNGEVEGIRSEGPTGDRPRGVVRGKRNGFEECVVLCWGEARQQAQNQRQGDVVRFPLAK